LECLAVICLMGILAALLFPAVGAVRNSTLRHRSRWEFREIVTALELYAQYYGAPPQFLRGEETVIPLAAHGEALRAALLGREDGPADPLNPHNVKFGTKNFDRLRDAFGNENLFLLKRRADRLVIPRSAFPPSVRDAVPPAGVADAYAIWNETDDGGRRVNSWQ
jgi:hypothetical protein